MKLPDALLVRDAWMGVGPRERRYDGHVYHAISVWADEAGAREAAAAIRAKGGLARTTKEVRPWRAPPPEIASKLPIRPCRQSVGYVRDRRMWVVWEGHPGSPNRRPEEIDP